MEINIVQEGVKEDPIRSESIDTSNVNTSTIDVDPKEHTYSSPVKSRFEPFDISVVVTPKLEGGHCENDITKEEAMAVSPPHPDHESSVPDIIPNTSTEADVDVKEPRISGVSESSAESSSVPAPSSELLPQTSMKKSAGTISVPAKKPSNLVSNQTSFLPGSKPKTLVPALQLAAKAKEAEAAKALQREAERKRRELESKERSAKPAAIQSVSAHASRPMNSNISKPNFMKSTGGGKQVISSLTTAKASTTTAPSVPKSKGGIIGFIKKTFTPGKEKAPKTPDASKEGSIKENNKPTQEIHSKPSVTSTAKATPQITAPAPPTVSVSVPAPATVSQEKKIETEAPPVVNDEYEIEDRCSSGSDDSGTDDDDKEERRKNTIPDWARGAQLKEALEKQFGFNGHIPMDPDTIFYEVSTCSLEEIFGKFLYLVIICWCTF